MNILLKTLPDLKNKYTMKKGEGSTSILILWQRAALCKVMLTLILRLPLMKMDYKGEES